MLVSLLRPGLNSRLGTLRLSVLILFLGYGGSIALSPYFLTSGNVENLVTQVAALCISAMGQALVIVTGGLIFRWARLSA